jgi:hypothetical protein
MSRKHAAAPPPEWFPTANAIRRRLNERLAEGGPRSAMAIAMDDIHCEVFRIAGGAAGSFVALPTCSTTIP